MPKWVKFLVGLALLPVCAGAAMALWQVIRSSGSADTFWVAWLGGVGCWVAIFLLLPKPMWVYVFGHELTHAIWNWLFGGSLKRFKVTSNGGHVVVTKNNFLIALAPYFFPLYVFLVVMAFALGHLVWGWSRYLVFFHLLVGAAYAFHVTLTWHILQTRQSDITSQGYLFSATVIFLGNVLVLLIGIPLLTEKVGLFNAFGWWFEFTGQALHWIGRLLGGRI